jgi:hypothetical protein
MYNLNHNLLKMQSRTCRLPDLYSVLDALKQAFSQKGVQASWDAPRTKNGRLCRTPKFWGKGIRIIIIHLTF